MSILSKIFGSKSTKTKAATSDMSAFSLVLAPDGYLLPSISFSDTDLERLATAAVWSYVAIKHNSASMAALPAVVQQLEHGQWKKIPDHPLYDLIRDPLGPSKRTQFWSWSHLLELVMMHRYLCGNAYLVPAARATGDRILALYPLLQPHSMKAKEDQTGEPEYYTYRGKRYETNQIVNVMAPSPGSFWRGLAPIKAALNDITTSAYASERQKYDLKNRIGAGTIITVNDPYGTGFQDSQLTDLENKIKEKFSSVTNQGDPIALSDATVDLKAPPTAGDLQYFDTLKWNRDNMLAVLGMPPPIAGVLDNAILSNFKVATRIHWTSFLFPILNSVYSSINSQLIHRVYGDNVRLWYDFSDSDIALALFEQRLDVALKLQKLGYSTNDINDRMRLEMPDRPELAIVNTQLVQAGRLDELRELLDQRQDAIS